MHRYENHMDEGLELPTIRSNSEEISIEVIGDKIVSKALMKKTRDILPPTDTNDVYLFELDDFQVHLKMLETRDFEIKFHQVINLKRPYTAEIIFIVFDMENKNTLYDARAILDHYRTIEPSKGILLLGVTLAKSFNPSHLAVSPYDIDSITAEYECTVETIDFKNRDGVQDWSKLFNQTASQVLLFHRKVQEEGTRQDDIYHQLSDKQRKELIDLREIWRDEKHNTPQQKILALLAYYTKVDWMARTFSGAWRRHHLKAVSDIKKHSGAKTAEQLFTEIQQLSSIKKDGSLATIIHFLTHCISLPHEMEMAAREASREERYYSRFQRN